MREIIIWIAIIFAGFVAGITVMVSRGIFSPVVSFILIAALAGLSSIAGILLSPYSFSAGNFSKKKKGVFYAIAIALCILQFLTGCIFPTPVQIVYCSPVQQGQSSPLAPINNGIGVTQADDGEIIGISDGSFAFDTNTAPTQNSNVDLQDITEKCAATEQLAHGDSATMMQSLQVALSKQPNDAEAQILLEDQKVINSGTPYATVVVATMLTGNDQTKIGVGRDTLRGVFAAQLEYNIGAGSHMLPNGRQILVLIANAGSDPKYVTPVAQQIIQVAANPMFKPFIGVIGWNFSSYAENEIKVLDSAHIPMISPTASEDNLTSKSSDFFRVTPTNKKEAMIGANYIHTSLQSKCILLLVGNDPFSQNLAEDFKAIYTTYGYISERPYSDNDPNAFNDLSTWFLQTQGKCLPDLIYYAGYPGDLISLVKKLNQTDAYASLKIAGGDSLYEVGFPYPPYVYSHLLFTAAASPDVWKNKELRDPPFYGEYAQDFDPSNAHPGTYGWSRADADSILSYDALLALLNGYTNALNKHANPTPQDIEQEMNNVAPFQGASGLVSLQDDNGNGTKVIVMLTVVLGNDGHAYTQIQQVYGCLTPNHCYP